MLVRLSAVVEGLPIPTQAHAPGACREIAALARHLSRRDDEEAYARLQGLVARLYRLSTAEFEHVLGTFPLIPRQIREASRRAFAGAPGSTHV